MGLIKCIHCGEEESLEGDGETCRWCGFISSLKAKAEPVAEVPCSDVVIKPCPFCGSEDLEMWNCSKDNVPNHVYCLNCLVDGPRQENKKEAIEAWNERASNVKANRIETEG